MDYDDNDFQSQNLHLAGEGSNKFPPVLRSFALPKFDFDDSLHGSLRFDTLVETEVFLGIESNEDSQWIEDYSKGSSGIQFNSSAAESCTIPRRNNVWSEATSSESVEMLLKSVGQEELIPAQTNTKESDACDELGCIIKHMEPSLKQDSNIPARVGDITDIHSTILRVEENFPVLVDDGGGRKTLVEDSSQTHISEVSLNQNLADLSTNDVGVGLHTSEGNSCIDCGSHDVNQRDIDTIGNTSIGTRTEEGSGLGEQIDVEVATEQNITAESAVLNNEDASNHVNETVDKSTDSSNTDNGKYQEMSGELSQEAQRHTQILNAEMVDSVGSHLNDPHCMASMESVVETGTVGTASVEEPCKMPRPNSSYDEHDESQKDAHEVSMVVIEGNTATERHEVETSNVENRNIASKLGASLLSTGDHNASQAKVDGNSSSYGAICSSFPETCSSPTTLVGSTQTCEKDVVCRPGDVDKNSPVERGENPDLSFDNINTNRIINKGVETSPFGDDRTGTGLTASRSQSDCCTAVGKSTDGVSMPFRNDIKIDSVDHKDFELSPLTAAHTYSDKKGDISARISAESNLAEHKAASLVTVDVRSVLAVDSCNMETQIESESVAIGRGGQECMKDKEACPVPYASTANKGNSIDAGANEEVGMHGPRRSAVKDLCQGTSQVGNGEPVRTVSGGVNFDQIAVPIIKVGQESCTGIVMPPSGTPTVITPTKLSHGQLDEKQIQRSSDQSVSVSGATYGDATKVKSAATDPDQNNVSNDESSFTFKINSLADLPQKDAKWQTISNAEVNKALLTVDGSTSNSGTGQLVPCVSQDISHGNPKISDIATSHSGSKGNSDRKPRRVSGKVTDRETVKKGKPTKAATSVRVERGNKVTAVSLSPSGLAQLVQSNDLQHFGHINSSSTKPLVTTSTSGLPDLNSSVSQAAMFQQPFTDLQQVQLRAQIFVYGALIQGTAPDEAYMISAFGGLNSDRSIWENSWRLCMERLHGQRSHLITPETPAQSRPGARAAEQSIKQSGLQSKIAPSPTARDSCKSTPIVNPVVPFSSPLWSMSTPVDTLQSSSIPRAPVMDYQRPVSPLHPHQTPVIRSFVAHSPSWLSQAPFGGHWVATPPTSVLETSGRFSVQLPMTEPVQFTPAKESSVSCSSGAKPTASVAHSTTSAGVFDGSSVLDVKMVTASAGQPSADPKPRKRKKTSANENHGHISLPPQTHLELIIAPVVASSVSASVPIIAPHGFDSKASSENFITAASPMSSTNLGKVDQNAELSAVLPEECLGNVQEARVQADVASALAASAVTHSQEIWGQLDKQRNVDVLPDIEIKLASAAVSLAAAAAVAKAAAAAARVASNAALQAKLMAEEALVSVGKNTYCESNAIPFSGGMENLGKATPASILKGDDRTNSSSILVAAREAASRRVEDASAASKRAENMDAIIKAAELAAEAVSQAGRIVAMGDPLPLSELVAAGPEGYWKAARETSEPISKLNHVGRENVNLDSFKGPDMWARQLKEVPSQKKENQITSQGKSFSIEVISREDHNKLTEEILVSSATTMKDKEQKDSKAADLQKTLEVAPESENRSKSSMILNEFEKAEAPKEDSIKEDSNVEVFKNGNGFKAAWFLAKVLTLKDGKAYVRHMELTSGEGSEKLEEWVSLEGDEDEAPKIRIARPINIMPLKGTRKRRRAAMVEHTWSTGNRVDAWMHDSWWEGIITENSKKDDSVQVSFPAQGETTSVNKWNLRSSLFWKDGKWIEWSSSVENKCFAHEGDTPQEKRPRVRSPVAVITGKDKASKTTDASESDKSDDPTLLALSADEKLFNIGKKAKDGNRTGALRMTRTGLQKEGSKVVFGVPKPGKKRKFMEVSKHYVADKSGKLNEANDPVKFSKYLMHQGAGSRGWKSSKTDINEKRPAISKSRVHKSGTQNISGRTIQQKETLTNIVPGDSALTDHVTNTKGFLNHTDNASENNLTDFQSFSAPEATEGPILFSALALPSDNVSSKKIPQSSTRSELASKGKLAPAGGKFSKIEDGTLNGHSAKSASDHVEPRRSNRRIQPTSRLLEGLQSSLMVSKIPSVLHDKSHKSRNVSRGTNNHD